MDKNHNGGTTPKTFITQVDTHELAYHNPIVTGRLLLTDAGYKNLNCYTLYQKFKGCDFEKISLDEQVDLSKEGIEHFITKGPDIFHYQVDKEPEMIDKSSTTSREILKLKGLDADKYFLIYHPKNKPEVSYAGHQDKEITMDCKGMVFTTHEIQHEIDIEIYGKTCKEVPLAASYKVKVDKSYHVLKKPTTSPDELIKLEGKSPVDNWDVFKFMNGNPKPIKIKAGEEINVRERCLVRFVLLPKEQQDGRTGRVQFTLPEEDIEFLNQQGLPWETLSFGGLWLIIYDFPLPEGYQVTKTDVALTISSHYPTAEIDMAYFFPPLQKSSGIGINAISEQLIDGRVFQRWSRHRKPGEWRPGVDSLATHLALVENWLIKDLER